MKKYIYLSILTFMLFTSVIAGEDYKKLGQTNFLFLSVPVDARGTALGAAQTADTESGLTSIFYNPAILALYPNKLGFETHYFNFLYEITHYAAAGGLKLGNNRGVIGFHWHYVDLGDFDKTILADNAQGYYDLGKDYLSEFAAGITYSKKISEQFSIGFNLKYATQNLGYNITLNDDGNIDGKKHISEAFAVDFGTIFDTRIRGLKFGVSVRNFSAEPVYEKNSFQLPMSFSIGLSSELFELLNKTGYNKTKLYIDLVHPRAYPEYINAGVELDLSRMMYLRAGYMANRDIFDGNIGFGIRLIKFDLDYSYSATDYFSDTQKFSIKFNI